MATTHPDRADWEVVEVLGALYGASNATLLGRLGDGTEVVYKPIRGEAPLWDFPLTTLAIREVLTFEVSEAAGFGVVPETRWADGPYGPGSAQRFLTEDPTADQRRLVHPTMDPRLWAVAALDVVTNNADRKLGHLLPTTDGRVWAIDNALTFHPQDKLRTVLWGFSGERAPVEVELGIRRLAACVDELSHRLAKALGPAEARAFSARVDAMAEDPVHPHPPEDRPPMPWPVW